MARGGDVPANAFFRKRWREGKGCSLIIRPTLRTRSLLLGGAMSRPLAISSAESLANKFSDGEIRLKCAKKTAHSTGYSARRGVGFKSRLDHHPVHQFLYFSENRSKSARVRAICEPAGSHARLETARIPRRS